jgi:hypothetical protein
MEPGRNACFALLAEVGTSGKYQTLLIVFSCLLAFQCGIIALGTPYYFAVAPYTCPPPHRGPNCNHHVCSLPRTLRDSYLQPEIAKLRTLGN